MAIAVCHQNGSQSINLALTPTKYEFLQALVSDAGKVPIHSQLTHAVWGGYDGADSHLLRVNISNLRKN
jgi:two-component system KDP operon response regulator KdpE